MSSQPLANQPRILEIFGEGKSDVARPTDSPVPPTEGVVPILTHTLCGNPGTMQVKRKPYAFLQGKGCWQKVKFAKRQAFYNNSSGAVFVLDTEGDVHGVLSELRRGRDAALPQFPMAIGAAHACIEAWLLADAAAIRRGMGLASAPAVPDEPERLPAPRHDRRNNPKTVLGACAGAGRELAAREKDAIARNMRDMVLARERCPLSFAPFAEDVEATIRPLFA